MKKFLSILLALTMMFSVVMLASCSKEPEEPTTFESSEEHLKYVANKAVKNASENVLANYAGKTDEKIEDKTTYDLKISVDDSLINVLKSFLGAAAGQIDLSFLKTIGLTLVDNRKGDVRSEGVSLTLNGKTLLDGLLCLDKNTGEIKASIPLVSADTLKITADELAEIMKGGAKEYDDEGEDGEETARSSIDVAKLLEGFKIDGKSVFDAAPSKETLKKLIERYTEALTNCAKNVTEGEEDVTIGEVTEKFVIVTTSMSADDLLAAAKSVLSLVKSDEDVKQIVEAAGGEKKSDAYKSFTDAIDKALEKVNGFDAAKLPSLTVKVCTDKKNVVKATKLTITAEGKSAEFVLGQTENEGKYGAEFSAKIPAKDDKFKTVSIVSTGEIKDGKQTGDFVISYDGGKIATVKVEGFDKEALKNGALVGKISLNIGEIVNAVVRLTGKNGGNSNMAIITALIGGWNVVLEGDKTEDEKNLTIKLAGGDTNLLKIDCSAKKGAAENVSVPEGGKSMEEFSKGLEMSSILEKLMGKLKEAGVPEELLEKFSGGSEIEYED